MASTPNAQFIQLNLVPNGRTPVVYASQYDVGRPIVFEFYDGDENRRYLLDQSIVPVIMGTKPDDTVFAYTCDVTDDGNAQIDTKIQMVAVSGNIDAEIVLYRDDDIIGSINMIISVEQSGINRYANLSHTEIPAIIDAAKSNADAAAAALDLTEKAARDASIWAAWSQAHAVGEGTYTDEYGDTITLTDELSAKKWSIDSDFYKAWANAYATGTGTYTDKNGKIQTVKFENNVLSRTTLADYYQALAKSYADGKGTYTGEDGYQKTITYDKSAKQFKCDADEYRAKTQAYLTGTGTWTDFYDVVHEEYYPINVTNSGDVALKAAAQSRAHASGQGEWVDLAGDKHVEIDEENSKSYAIGGTNIRIGENTDNAKYYYEWCLRMARPFVGATASTDGVYGYVPAPLKGQDDEALLGNGIFGYTTKIGYKGNHSEASSSVWSTISDYGTADGKGLYITGSSNDNNTPSTYGNILNLIGDGSGQLLTEWISGATLNTGNLYYRSHGASSSAGWGPWMRIAYTYSPSDSFVDGAYRLGKRRIGGGTNPIYIDSNGYPKESTSLVGSENTPVYLQYGILHPITKPIPVSLGGTGATNASAMRENLGITSIISGLEMRIKALEDRPVATRQPTTKTYTGRVNVSIYDANNAYKGGRAELGSSATQYTIGKIKWRYYDGKFTVVSSSNTKPWRWKVTGGGHEWSGSIPKNSKSLDTSLTYVELN